LLDHLPRVHDPTETNNFSVYQVDRTRNP